MESVSDKVELTNYYFSGLEAQVMQYEKQALDRIKAWHEDIKAVG